MRNVMSNQAQRHCYDAGREARDMGKDKTPPGGLGAQRRSYWLAGYNDRDIELQVAALKKLEAHRAAFPQIYRAWNDADPLTGLTSTRSEP